MCVLPPSLLVVSGVLTGAAEGASVDRCTVSETAAGATGRTPSGSLGHSSVLYRTTTAVLAVWCSVASQCLHGLYTAAEGTGAVKSTGDSIGRRISLARIAVRNVDCAAILLAHSFAVGGACLRPMHVAASLQASSSQYGLFCCAKCSAPNTLASISRAHRQ